MTDQPVSPPFLPGVPDNGTSDDDAELSERRRLPGEPHPYMLQRNPPNLWILVWMTVGSLVTAAIVLALTVLL
ncbi:MAG: hypothetical protein U0893_08910 [Chloroflexota bacterium]